MLVKNTVCSNCPAHDRPCEKFCLFHHTNVPELISFGEMLLLPDDEEEY